MNDLIAEAPAWQSPGYGAGEIVGAIPVVGSAYQGLTSGIGDGSWSGGLNGLINTTTDLASVLSDPLGALASSVASFLLDRVKPFQDMLDNIAGNPGEVEAVATTWGNVSDRLSQMRSDLHAAEQASLSCWSGGAGDAFRSNVQARIDDIDNITAGIPNLVTGHIVASGVVTAVRGIVSDLASELVGKLISYAARALYTFGLGVASIIADAVPTIRRWIQTGQEFLDRLTDAMGFLTEALDRVGDFMEPLKPKFDAIMQRVSTYDSAWYSNIPTNVIDGAGNMSEVADNVTNR